MKRAFTMIEILLATLITAVLTTLSIVTFNAVSNGWQISTDYVDKTQRTDFALNQLVSGLRSMYYPHDGVVHFQAQGGHGPVYEPPIPQWDYSHAYSGY